MQDRVVTINGFSKGFAMTGWRVGYMAAPMWLAKACEKMQGQTTSAPASIAQRAALAALQGGRTITQPMTATYRKRRDLCMALLEAIPGLHCSKPLGAFYLFPDVSAYFGCTDGRSLIQNPEALCMYLLQEAHVSVVPGSAFGAPNCLRLSYAAAEAQLHAAFKQIRAALAKLQTS